MAAAPALPDAARVLRCAGAFGDAERLAYWQTLLLPRPCSVEAEELLTAAVAAVDLDLPNQRVVTVDVLRTRGETFTADDQLPLQLLLTAFVRGGYTLQPGDAPLVLSGPRAPPTLSYRQGLNEIMGVLWWVTAGVPPSRRLGATLMLAAAVVRRFAPRIFGAGSDDAEFTSLQCSLRLLRLLLQYHDGELSRALDTHEVAPELYATPWLLTLFARGLDLPTVCVLWDHLFACSFSPGPVLLHAVAVAFMRSHRPALLACLDDAGELMMAASKLVWAGPDHVRSVVREALAIASETPVSFRRLVDAVCYTGAVASSSGGVAPLPVSPALLARLDARLCVKITVDELVTGASSRFDGRSDAAAHESEPAATLDALSAVTAGAGAAPSTSAMELVDVRAAAGLQPRYFLIDCRRAEEFEACGHLPTAFHLDPQLLEDPERLDDVLAGFVRLEGVHICVSGPGNAGTWYHAPIVPAELMEGGASAAPAAHSHLSSHRGSLIAGGGGTGGAAVDIATAATREGLDPLSSESADYAATGDVTQSLVLLLLQRGCNRVSEVEGGFVALHQRHAFSLDSMLVGHTVEGCCVCGGEPAAVLGAASSATTISGAAVPSGSSSGGRSGRRLPALAGAVATPLARGIHAAAAGVAGARRALTNTNREAVSKRVGALTAWLRPPPDGSGTVAAAGTAASGVQHGARARETAQAHASTHEPHDEDDLVVVHLFRVDDAAAPAPTSRSSRASSIASPTPSPSLSPPSAAHASTTVGQAATAASGRAAQQGVAIAQPRPAAGAPGVAAGATGSKVPAVVAARPAPRGSTSRRATLGSGSGGGGGEVGSAQGRTIIGFDASGLPMLSEEALLEMQCDGLERLATLRKQRSAGGGAGAPTAFGMRWATRASEGAAAVLPTPAAGGREAAAVVNVDEALAAKAAAAARAAKTTLTAWLRPPPAGGGGAGTSSDVAASAAPPPLDVLAVGPGLAPATQRALPPSPASSGITYRTTRFLAAHGGGGGGGSGEASSSSSSGGGARGQARVGAVV